MAFHTSCNIFMWQNHWGERSQDSFFPWIIKKKLWGISSREAGEFLCSAAVLLKVWTYCQYLNEQCSQAEPFKRNFKEGIGPVPEAKQKKGKEPQSEKAERGSAVGSIVGSIGTGGIYTTIAFKGCSQRKGHFSQALWVCEQLRSWQGLTEESRVVHMEHEGQLLSSELSGNSSPSVLILPWSVQRCKLLNKTSALPKHWQ